VGKVAPLTSLRLLKTPGDCIKIKTISRVLHVFLSFNCKF
jgi:hypothetical protein